VISRLKDWVRDERGASAAEFGLLLTPLTLLLFGVMHLCLFMYSSMQLDYAAEATARCMVTAANASANGGYADTCYNATGSPSATTYFNGLYHGFTTTPSLVQLDETVNCQTQGTVNTDYQVVATANYQINAFFFEKTVTLTAKACFPHS
jgi:Flp pilus assembly protein TadG